MIFSQKYIRNSHRNIQEILTEIYEILKEFLISLTNSDSEELLTDESFENLFHGNTCQI